jgi:transcriptional regulator with XRE-family HTH domain
MINNLKNWYAMSNPAILEVLGDYLKQTRLKQNRTQKDIAEIAGIDRTTLVKMEGGKGGTLISFIQILRALEQLHLLENFEVKREISPIKLAKLEMKKRQRASKNISQNNKPMSTW